MRPKLCLPVMQLSMIIFAVEWRYQGYIIDFYPNTCASAQIKAQVLWVNWLEPSIKTERNSSILCTKCDADWNDYKAFTIKQI